MSSEVLSIFTDTNRYECQKILYLLHLLQGRLLLVWWPPPHWVSGLWDVCIMDQRKCKHCPFQIKAAYGTLFPLSSCLQAEVFFPSGVLQFLSESGMIPEGFSIVSALSVVWSMGHLQIWDWWLSAILAGGVSWGPALHQPSFLFLLLRRLLVPLCWGYFKQSQGPVTVLWRSPHPPGAGCGRDRRGPEDFVGSLSPVWIQADCKMKCRYQGSWHEGSASPAQHLCSSYHLDFLAQAVSSATCFMPQFLFWGRSHLVLAPFSAL